MADDVVADTFLTAFRARLRYDLHRPDSRPWLRRRLAHCQAAAYLDISRCGLTR
jgi:hypothetical protein